MGKAEIEAFISARKLSVRCVFVPFSRCKDRRKEWKCFNWSVTVVADADPNYHGKGPNGREIITTDYAQGIGHSPLAKIRQKYAGSIDAQNEIDVEIETGRECESHGIPGRSIPAPALADILYSLASDTSAIDSGTFESWCDEMGSDPDSRATENIYRACVEIGLKLRAALGDAGLTELRRAVV